MVLFYWKYCLKLLNIVGIGKDQIFQTKKFFFPIFNLLLFFIHFHTLTHYCSPLNLVFILLCLFKTIFKEFFLIGTKPTFFLYLKIGWKGMLKKLIICYLIRYIFIRLLTIFRVTCLLIFMLSFHYFIPSTESLLFGHRF